MIDYVVIIGFVVDFTNCGGGFFFTCKNFWDNVHLLFLKWKLAHAHNSTFYATISPWWLLQIMIGYFVKVARWNVYLN